ncbi:anti-repressor SinI family protein [Sutcliffiella cohnii]|nr:anti-repressor SinI family protein [Sutcliffiella cohnii]
MDNNNVYISVDSSQKLDSEWVTLILEARDLGLTIEEIHNFLKWHGYSL